MGNWPWAKCDGKLPQVNGRELGEVQSTIPISKTAGVKLSMRK
jgi:hypothetical protein